MNPFLLRRQKNPIFISKKLKIALIAGISIFLMFFFSTLFLIDYLNSNESIMNIITGNTVSIKELQFSPSGDFLYIETAKSSYVYDMKNSKSYRLEYYKTSSKKYFSPDSANIAYYAPHPGEIVIFNLKTKKRRSIITNNDCKIVGFSPDSKSLLFIDSGKLCFHPASGNIIYQKKIRIDNINQDNSDGKKTETCFYTLPEMVNRGYIIKIVSKDMGSKQEMTEVALMDDNLNEVLSFDYKENSCRKFEHNNIFKTGLCLLNIGEVHRYDFKTGGISFIDPTKIRPIDNFSISKDGSCLAFSNNNNKNQSLAGIYNINEKQHLPIKIIPKHNKINTLALSTKNNILAIGYDKKRWQNGSIELFNVENGRKVKTIYLDR